MNKNYLKHLFTCTITGLFAAGTMAQSTGSYGIEFNGGMREYIGDLGSSLFFNRAPIYQGGGAAFTYSLSPSIDAVANVSFGEVGATENIYEFVRGRDIVWRSFRAQTGDLSFGARYKLNNGAIMSESSKFAPYLYGAASEHKASPPFMTSFAISIGRESKGQANNAFAMIGLPPIA